MGALPQFPRQAPEWPRYLLHLALGTARVATLVVALLALAGLGAAAESVGPFTLHHTGLDPAGPQPAQVARDGTVASVTSSGDDQRGELSLQLWAGDNQQGGWGYGGVNLHGPAAQAAWIGLHSDWSIRQGVDPVGSWIYYPRFQQDAVLAMGYGRLAAADLPSDTRLHLTSNQPFDRVVLALPFRWLLGGGSAYQTGLNNGNPPTAGVWAVPAGMRLSEVQSQPGTYLLAPLNTLLAEVPPHRWHSRFHLDVSVDYPGGWLLAVDLNGNGQVDVRTHGSADGHRALPFAALNRDSGLLISARPAFGVSGGQVGRTDMRLSYEISPAAQIPGLDELTPPLLAPGLAAAFYDLEGPLSHIPDLDNLIPDIERIDGVVNYPSTNAPWPGLPTTMADYFAARHQGYLYIEEAGEYTLEITSDDGSRLYLNGQPAINNDGLHGMQRRSITTHLDAGLHPIRLDYFENTGGAGLIFTWIPPGSDARQVVPAGNLFHGPTNFPDRAPTIADLPPGPVLPLDTPDLEPGLALSVYDLGSPLSRVPHLDGLTADLTGIDSVVHYPSTSSAWPNFPAHLVDYFATRHRGYLKVEEAGIYTIEIESDDGSLLHLGYLSGQPLIDNDGRHGMRRRAAAIHLESGFHPINLDFFENTGGAGLILRWQPPGAGALSVIPAAHLFHGYPAQTAPQGTALLDRRPLVLELPEAARSSPVLIAGRAWSAAHQVIAHANTLPGGSQSLARLGARDVFIDLPLDPQADTVVTVSQTGQPVASSVDGQIEWLPISMYHNESIAIRLGSSIKLLASDGYPDGDIHIDATGNGVIDYTGPAYQAYVHQYLEAGVFTAVATNATGDEIGRSVITVGNLHLPSRIAAQVGYRRPVKVHTGVFSPADLIFTAVNPDALQVELVEAEGPHALITVRPLARGDHTLLIQHRHTGVLLHAQEIYEFTLTVPRAGNTVGNARTAEASMQVLMVPYIPDVNIRFEMFAAQGTFLGGVKAMTINTDRTEPLGGQPAGRVRDHLGEEAWSLALKVLLPGSEYCFDMWATEFDEDVPGIASDHPQGLGDEAIMAAESPGGSGGGPGSGSGTDEVQIGNKVRVNGTHCYVTRYFSLVFARAGEQEREVAPSGNPEPWLNPVSDSWTYDLLTESSCELDDEGDEKDCSDISYEVIIRRKTDFEGDGRRVDPPPLKAQIVRDEDDGDCKDCKHDCEPYGEVIPGNQDGFHATFVKECEGDEDDETEAGGMFLSILDAHGLGSGTDDQFPKYAEALPRRRGTAYDPVIIIETGSGTAEHDGFSLYGTTTCDKSNRWTFTAKADEPDERLIKATGPIRFRWRMSDGQYESFSSQSITPYLVAGTETSQTITVEFPPGRWHPRLEVYYDNSKPDGESIPDQLIGYAEIHSIVVENQPGDNVPKRPAKDVPNFVRHGSAFHLTNHAGGMPVDARIGIVPADGNQDPARIRGRISPDGYPQNQYWTGSEDLVDLPQVSQIPHGNAPDLSDSQIKEINDRTSGRSTMLDAEPQRFYIQGYILGSATENDLEVQIEGQALIEECDECPVFTPDYPEEDVSNFVKPMWQEADKETFTSLSIFVNLDRNRDKNIFSVTQNKTWLSYPFVFWVDGDANRHLTHHNVFDGEYQEYDNVEPVQADGQNDIINTAGGLQDYAPMLIAAGNRALLGEFDEEQKASDFIVRAGWYAVTEDGASGAMPHIRVHLSRGRDGGYGYLRELDSARELTGNQVFSKQLFELKNTADIFSGLQGELRGHTTGFEEDMFGWQRHSLISGSSHHMFPLIFNVAAAGRGELMIQLVHKQSRTVVATDRQHVYFKDVEDMFERWTVGDGEGVLPEDMSKPEEYAFDEDDIIRENELVIFVHGWNLSDWERRAFAQTAFKRMWWNGYDGQYAAFMWPTHRTDDNETMLSTENRQSYSLSEYIAWLSSDGLSSLIAQKKENEFDKISLKAHSLGNIVAGEALHKLALAGHKRIVDNYVSVQSAVPASQWSTHNQMPRIGGGWSPQIASKHLFWGAPDVRTEVVYDGTVYNSSALFPDASVDTPRAFSGEPYWKLANNAVDNVYNYYNRDDFAVAGVGWVINQLMKQWANLPAALREDGREQFAWYLADRVNWDNTKLAWEGHQNWEEWSHRFVHVDTARFPVKQGLHLARSAINSVISDLANTDIVRADIGPTMAAIGAALSAGVITEITDGASFFFQNVNVLRHHMWTTKRGASAVPQSGFEVFEFHADPQWFKPLSVQSILVDGGPTVRALYGEPESWTNKVKPSGAGLLESRYAVLSFMSPGRRPGMAIMNTGALFPGNWTLRNLMDNDFFGDDSEEAESSGHHIYHSHQFRSTIMQNNNYYDSFLRDIGGSHLPSLVLEGGG